VRRQYHLRGCRPLTPGERDYKHCLYAHLKFCTAPCIQNVTRDQYLDQVRAACDFLEGECHEMQERLGVEKCARLPSHRILKKASRIERFAGRHQPDDQQGKPFAIASPTACPSPLSRKKTSPNWDGCLGCGPTYSHRGLRYLEYQRHLCGRIACKFSERTTGPLQLSPIQNSNQFRGQDDFASISRGPVRRRYSRLFEELRPTTLLVKTNVTARLFITVFASG
jgi:excinuclease ABC subunit C